ncbi:MAG: ABC transporter permease [Acidobacteria bacterium]|nr:ABC transporter permease [Acidobacteriota bacterium]
MLREIFKQAWIALTRHPLRSFLTMLGIIWGIVAVTLLISYGAGFRFVMMRSMEGLGKTVVICFGGQTSEQAGGQRSGRRIRLDVDDLEFIRAEAPLVKFMGMETIRRIPIAYQERVVASNPIRGVYPIHGTMRNEVATAGRWISEEDQMERRRVVVLGEKLKRRLFRGLPAVGETVTITGIRFTVIGTMDRKMSFGNYNGNDDESAFIPYSVAGDLWNTKVNNIIVFSPTSPQFEEKAMVQVRAALAKRHRFSPTDKRAVQMFGTSEIRPIIDALTIGLQVLLLFVGTLTLGIGGIGVMNIMLVSVDERIREIGLRRALGARRRHIQFQFLAEAMALTLLGGLVGIILSQAIATGLPTLPLLGSLFDDDSGLGDIHLAISWATMGLSVAVLFFVGVVSGLVPAIRASKMDPVMALRYE